MSVTRLFFTVWVRFLFALVFLLSCLPIFVFVFLVPQRYRYNRLYFFASYVLYKVILWASCVPYHVHGKQHIPKEPAIFVANHSSSLDIPIMGSLCGTHAHIWLAMAWLTNFIFFRYFLPRVAVLVDMSSPQKGGRSLIKTMQLMQQHAMHVIIFPEGGRFTDGTVHEFYGGFAVLAKRMRVPVVPVRIQNVEKVYPPDTFLMQRLPVRVHVGEAMRINHDETEIEFKDRVYAWFLQQDN